MSTPNLFQLPYNKKIFKKNPTKICNEENVLLTSSMLVSMVAGMSIDGGPLWDVIPQSVRESGFPNWGRSLQVATLPLRVPCEGILRQCISNYFSPMSDSAGYSRHLVKSGMSRRNPPLPPRRGLGTHQHHHHEFEAPETALIDSPHLLWGE